jgi:hypothetical protein
MLQPVQEVGGVTGEVSLHGYWQQQQQQQQHMSLAQHTSAETTSISIASTTDINSSTGATALASAADGNAGAAKGNPASGVVAPQAARTVTASHCQDSATHWEGVAALCRQQVGEGCYDKSRVFALTASVFVATGAIIACALL